MIHVSFFEQTCVHVFFSIKHHSETRVASFLSEDFEGYIQARQEGSPGNVVAGANLKFGSSQFPACVMEAAFELL